MQPGEHLRQQALHVAQPLPDADEVDAERVAAHAALHVVRADVDGHQRVVRLWACRNSTAWASWVPSAYAQRPPSTMVTTVSPLHATLTSLVFAVLGPDGVEHAADVAAGRSSPCPGW